MTILEEQIERLYNIELKLEEIIRHPNRSLLDIVMIDYIILLRDDVEDELQVSKIAKNLGDELIINRQIEYNTRQLLKIEPEVTSIYNLINK